MLLRDWVSFSPEMPSSNECVETERVSNNVEARAMASKRSELGFAMLVFGLFAVARDSVSYFCSWIYDDFLRRRGHRAREGMLGT